MENIRKILDTKLLAQSFDVLSEAVLPLESAQKIAQLYANLENGISVLSDLKTRKSYLYYGSVAERLGLERKQNEINSIWEDELLNLVRSDDRLRKYNLELRFFKHLKSIDLADRSDYQVITKLRIRTSEGKEMLLKHRLMYVGSSADGNIRLALCLYNVIYEYLGFDAPEGVIINTRTGDIVDGSFDKPSRTLSSREKEIILLIKQGKRTKEIAHKLLLSIHTINRHRQNIFKKLEVNNAIEACRIAEVTGLI
ncbi:response regulator transcription factor [Pedobacter jejuensis]|uniref:DNA-binding response regulator n=1 Tax=Pedobacter jejuensis TaxID=1268550 RepID=A0A3N0BQ52_9SPHI|nr:LuxR C-terminal-related transcriptional regulator [Pedobacter jejuensis]RNL51177.1 DNA-binding response regulator [Pedobacter jejuensis]